MPIPSARRIAPALIVIAVAALLRLDAITQSYGPVQHPAWLQRAQMAVNTGLGALRPASISWERIGTYPHRDGPPTQYLSDPYTYLIFAREMHSFYRPHHREPVFPFATKVWLWVLGGQDVAVSFASASFSVLVVFATYLLGATLASRGVAFAAALAMAIEYDVISWAVGGWRDDAFTFGVLMCTWAMVRYLRTPALLERSGARRAGPAIILGVFGGFTMLTRMTAVTFLAPGLLYLLVATKGPFRARAAGILLAVLALLTVAGPYLFNCWRAYGDPLYAINHLTGDQLVMEAAQTGSSAVPAPSASTTARQYLISKVTRRPFYTLDTVALGLTSYRWIPGLGTVLSWAAIAGLVLLAGSFPGRLVLLVLITSLVPAAVTWRLASDWRFTSHAYPFFLVASCLAFGHLADLARPSRVRERWARGRPSLRIVGFLAAGIIGLGAAVWVGTRTLRLVVGSESLRRREVVTIGTAGRDAVFFQEGWSEPETAGNVTLRAAVGSVSVIQVPLPDVDEYSLTVRLDPYPRPRPDENVRPPVVRIFMNNSLLATVALDWNPARVGSYAIKVDRASVKRGANRLIFMSDPPAASRVGEPVSQSFAVWYVRIRPVER